MDLMTFQDIYAQLLDNKRITLVFPSAESAETFRVKMSKYKTIQEELCAIVDMKVGSEKKIFSFRENKNLGKYVYQFQFREPPAETRYEILSVETAAEV